MRPATTADRAGAFRVLTQVFVRRLFDNDVISPHADRHESLAVVCGLMVSIGVFVTFFLSVNYLAAFIQLPGTAALSALSDRFLFIAGSMTISGLGALMVWEGLALEARDAAILGPLPVPARTITQAKLAAALIFGAVLTVALNAAPSVLYPALLTVNIRGIRGITLLQLMVAHGVTVTMAGLLGFFGVLATRSVLRALLGPHIFRRLSSGIQSALVVSLITALLLAPTVRNTDVRSHVASGTSWWPAEPVLWLLGTNETLAGHLVAETPLVFPPRITVVSLPPGQDRTDRAAYQLLLPRFVTLARRAWVSLPLVALLAVATFLWTNRRLPDHAARLPTRSRIRSWLRQIVERRTRTDPEVEAGFFFALQTLTRSAPHRTIVAVAMGVGITHTLIVLAKSHVPASTVASTPPGIFAISIGLLTSLLSGIVYALRIPADPAASWTIRMAWRGDERRYVAGVKQAALLAATLVLLVLLVLHVALLGLALALAHSAISLLFACGVLDVLLLPYRKLPFACSYVPLENPKVAWPAGLMGLLFVTYGFANVERWALQATPRAVAFGLALGALACFLRALDRSRRMERRPIVFDERPALATQRLGLFEHIAGND